MRELSATQQTSLNEIFGPRATFDAHERRFYRSDVGALPTLINPLVGNLTPAGVVRPHNEEEVVALAKFARRENIPLVPRAKATSGYGGVLPVAGGIVVDLTWLSVVSHIDAQAKTVTVQPGVVWEDLQKQLKKVGLDLCTYPSSAPSSTVGGWLAQGGMGYGAYAYGAFRESVLSARVVLPTGEVREFAGADLDLISDAEGITGIITSVTLRVREDEPEVLWGALFASVDQLASAIKAAQSARLPFWSISFINPTMADLKNKLPAPAVHGNGAHGSRPQMPVGYIAIFVAPAAQRDALEQPLQKVVRDAGGQMLDASLAQHEWDARFGIMHVKRLGPSVVPAEVVVPLAGLDKALNGISDQVKLPMSMEGMVSKSGDVTILGFILHDERTLGFNFAFGLALTVLKQAKRHGGRAYAAGLYFAKEAERVLGVERVRKLRAFKAQVDPADLCNPKKVLAGKQLLSAFMGFAEAFEPIVRIFGNAAKSPVGERTAGQGKRGIPDDVAWYAYACAQCGYCVNTCDQYYGRGWESQSPRGKWKWLRDYMEGKTEWDQRMVDTIMSCTTCEYCNVRCPLELPIESSWLKLRRKLIHEDKRLTFPPFEIMRASLNKERNIWGFFQKKRNAWVRRDEIGETPERADIAYFAGCTASYVENDIAQGATYLLRKAGVEFTLLGEDESCCGIPMLVSGLWDTWADNMKYNIAAMQKRGVKTVVTSCPACYLVWHTYYPEWAAKLGIEYNLETKHYSEVLADKVKSGELVLEHPINKTVTWHDSCHMGRAGGIYEPPRELLQAIPGINFVEMEHNREHAHCCGSVLTLVADPDAAARIGDVRIKEAHAVGAEAIVAACPCCEFQLRRTSDVNDAKLPVMDLAHLVARSVGSSYADPTEYAMEQWATFDAMIRLFKPKPMADFMAGMYPEMIDAMPGLFRGMMHMIPKAPAPIRDAMLAMMKPMMPILFPILLPGIMPKVMPVMLEEVQKVVPMSDDMKALLPDLMPAAMDNVMPKMLPQLMPFIVPDMIAYLRNGRH